MLLVYGRNMITAGVHVVVVLLMAVPGTACFPNSAVSIMELDQLGPLVTVGLITVVRVFYLLRDWRRRQQRDSAQAAEEEP
jgi:hypothetical protein